MNGERPKPKKDVEKMTEKTTATAEEPSPVVEKTVVPASLPVAPVSAPSTAQAEAATPPPPSTTAPSTPQEKKKKKPAQKVRHVFGC